MNTSGASSPTSDNGTLFAEVNSTPAAEKKGLPDELTYDATASVLEGSSASKRTLGRWQTTMIFVTNEVGLGVLSLPAALRTLGLIPGTIVIVGLGILTSYTAYELLQFYKKYPDVINIADIGRKIGGRWLELLVGTAFLVNLCLACASAGLTMSIALNTMTSHAMCTVGFIAISAVACWALCIPRSFSFVANLGLPSTISIIVAVIMVMASIGISGPQNAPPGFDQTIELVGSPSFTQGMVACLNIAFAYAGNQGFVTVMAEMKDPGRDFVPSLLYLQTFAVTIYAVVAAAIYALAGTYVTSPALGAAPVLWAKIAYGVAFPCLLGTGLVFGHTGIKFLYVVAMRRLGAAHEMTASSKRAWTTWLTCASLFWLAAFILANAIPVFSSILSVSSAVFVSWFTFGLSGTIWLFLNWNRQLQDWKKMVLSVLNWVIVVVALFMSTGGLYAAIVELLQIFRDPESRVQGPFTCADNGIF